MTKRLIGALLVGLWPISPAYALRARGADAGPTREEITGGLEENGRTKTAYRSGTAMTIPGWVLYLMGIPSPHQAAVAAARLLPNTRDMRAAVDTAIQLINDHPPGAWIYHPQEVTVDEQTRLSERAESLRRQIYAVSHNNSTLAEDLLKTLQRVADGPYEGTLDYRILTEQRLHSLSTNAPANDRVRLVRAIRLATILGRGGDTRELMGISNELTVLQRRLERLTAASGLEEKPIFEKIGGIPRYQRIVFGPGASAAATILAEVRKAGINDQEFTLLANSPESREALIRRIKNDGLSGYIHGSWIVPITKEDELESSVSAYKRTILVLQRQWLKPEYAAFQILLVQGLGEPKIEMPGVTRIAIPITSRGRDLGSMIQQMLRGYGVSINTKGLEAISREFLARQERYLRLEENL